MFKRITAGILPSSAAVFLIAASTFAADLERAAPEQAGLSSHRLARVGEAIESYIGAGRLAGAVVGVASENKIVYLETFGELNPGEPMREDAIFRIASMTKPVTSAAIMMLYEEGALLLTDPVSKFIPEFAEPQVLVLNDPADPSAGNRETLISHKIHWLSH